VLAEVVTVALALLLGPQVMRRRMQHTMRDGPSPEMRAWLDKWWSGRPPDEPAP
jgi:hypothetical protein